jgi:hypothetical protein
MSEAEVHRPLGEARVVLTPREPFLFRRRNEVPVDQESGSGVVEVARDAEDRGQDRLRAAASDSEVV